MVPQNNGGCRRARSAPQTPAGTPAPGSGAAREPEVRRWRRPTAEDIPPETLTTELCDLRRALDCQTQLLMEIRSLLERLTADTRTD